MKEQSIPETGFPHLRQPLSPPSDLGMPPATSLPVPRRRRDEGDLATLPHAAPKDSRLVWLDAFRTVRAETERRAAPLSAADQMVQLMVEARPTKWDRARQTW